MKKKKQDKIQGYNPTLGETWELTRKILEKSDLYNEILEAQLRQREITNEAVIRDAYKHLDKTAMYKKISDYIKGIILDAEYRKWTGVI